MKPLTDSFLSAIQQWVIRPGLLLRADLPSGAVYGWTGVFPFTWDDKTWEPWGPLVSVSPYEESLDSSAKGIIVELSHVDATRLSDVLNGLHYGCTAIAYLVLFDEDWSLIADPYVWFSGRIDSDGVDFGTDNLKLTINCEHLLSDLLRPHVYLYSPEDQALLHPGVIDTSQRYAHTLKDSTFSWGK